MKVQRKGIYEVMARDIGLLHKAAKLLPVTTLRGLVDLDMVLDELWMTTQEEMNFLTEAANAEEFARRNQDVVFVETPKLYKEHTTTHVLVMEYVEGFPINAREELLENGYDLKEIGRKFVDNYIKQVMEDGFFHADPHPGNVRIRGGKIVWLDMGMMGRLTERDRELIGEVIRGVASGDIGLIQEAVLALGDFRGKPDRNRLYQDISDLMSKYGSADMGTIDIGEVMQDLMDVMKENRISMPHGLTMLARGLTHMEGVLAEITPEINMTEIAAARIKADFIQKLDWKAEFKKWRQGPVPFSSQSGGHSFPDGGVSPGKPEGPDPDQHGSSRFRGFKPASQASGPQHRDGPVGDGSADQLQHHLHHGHEAQDHGDPGAGSFWLSYRLCDRDVCIYQAYLFQEIVGDVFLLKRTRPQLIC